MPRPPLERWFRVLHSIFAVTGWIDKPAVKAVAALLVGTLSFAAVYFERRELRLLAAAIGCALPLIYLIALALRGPVASKLNSAIDREREK